jgi:putative membrane protein
MKKDRKKGGFIARTIINAVAIYITASFLHGISINGFGAAIVAAVILGVVNALIRPILIILSLPINILSLGLFTLVINGILLKAVASITNGFTVTGFGTAIIASLIITILSSIISAVVL